MDKALVFGTKDCRFKSCQGHWTIHTRQKTQTQWLSARSSGCWPLLVWRLRAAPSVLHFGHQAHASLSLASDDPLA